MRGRLRRRPSAWFVAAALLASVASIGTLRAAARTATEQVLVAARELSVGSDPTIDGALAVTRIPAGATLPGMLATVSEVASRRLVVPLQPGEPLTEAVLGGPVGAISGPLGDGERAISIPGSAAGAALTVLVPGARIDIVGPTRADGPARAIVRGAEVISVQPGDDGGQYDAAAILVRVSEADALALSGALDRSATGVRVLPRPYAEEQAP